MSSPEGHSVNDGIPEPLCSLMYILIQDAARGILSMSQGAWLTKGDIKSTYRTVLYMLTHMIGSNGYALEVEFVYRYRSPVWPGVNPQDLYCHC